MRACRCSVSPKPPAVFVEPLHYAIAGVVTEGDIAISVTPLPRSSLAQVTSVPSAASRRMWARLKFRKRKKPSLWRIKKDRSHPSRHFYMHGHGWLAQQVLENCSFSAHSSLAFLRPPGIGDAWLGSGHENSLTNPSSSITERTHSTFLSARETKQIAVPKPGGEIQGSSLNFTLKNESSLMLPAILPILIWNSCCHQKPRRRKGPKLLWHTVHTSKVCLSLHEHVLYLDSGLCSLSHIFLCSTTRRIRMIDFGGEGWCGKWRLNTAHALLSGTTCRFASVHALLAPPNDRGLHSQRLLPLVFGHTRPSHWQTHDKAEQVYLRCFVRPTDDRLLHRVPLGVPPGVLGGTSASGILGLLALQYWGQQWRFMPDDLPGKRT